MPGKTVRESNGYFNFNNLTHGNYVNNAPVNIVVTYS
jgi:hypothetical protein